MEYAQKPTQPKRTRPHLWTRSCFYGSGCTHRSLMTVAVSSSSSTGKPWNSPFARQHPLAFLALAGIAGLLVACAVVWFLVLVANLFPEKTWISQLDDSVTNWLTQHGSARSDALFSGISLLGGWALFVAVVAAVAAFGVRKDWRRAATIVVTCGGASLLNAVLRLLFQYFRPLNATEFTTAAQSWNFPSGHAINSLVGYGILAYLFLEGVRSARMRTLITLLVIALVGAIGFTRIYLGVHSLSDVVTG